MNIGVRLITSDDHRAKRDQAMILFRQAKPNNKPMKSPRLLTLLALVALFCTASLSQAKDAITVDFTHIAHRAGRKPHKVCRFAVTNFSGKSAEILQGEGRYLITQTFNRDHTIAVRIVHSTMRAGATKAEVVSKQSLTVKEGQRASTQQDEHEFEVIVNVAR